MILTTERLRIVPLTPPRLKLWVHDPAALEQELGCRCVSVLMSGEFGQIVAGQYAAALNDRNNYLFYTFWLLIRRAADRTLAARWKSDTGWEKPSGNRAI